MYWYDVHFSLNGFLKIQASDHDNAANIAETLLNEQKYDIENIIATGIGIEIVDTIPEEEYLD